MVKISTNINKDEQSTLTSSHSTHTTTPR